MGHMPWLGSLFFRLPNFANSLKAFRAHAKKCALERKQRPSYYKDLFYYLVGFTLLSSMRENLDFC
jgi:hypothetical protein